MNRISSLALVLALLAGAPSLAHETPVRGAFYYHTTAQYNITGAVYQLYDAAGTATTIGDFDSYGDQVVYTGGSFVLGHATLITARGDLWISYYGTMDQPSGYVFGYFTIDGGTGSYEHHYGWGVIVASLTDNWIYIDGVKNHP